MSGKLHLNFVCHLISPTPNSSPAGKCFSTAYYIAGLADLHTKIGWAYC